jgi:uncharacterized protein YqfA (UPF0365 family)
LKGGEEKMKLRDAVKQDVEKAQSSADDLRSMASKMDPEMKMRVQKNVDTIRESINDIRSMMQQAGDMEVK